MPESNPVVWFEIPTADLERAIRFYETVFEIKMKKVDLGPLKTAWFPAKESNPGSAGALVFNKEHYKPSKEGSLVYINAYSGDLNNELARVEVAGGHVHREKFSIGEHGFVGIIFDSEGNRIAIHSMK